MSKMIKKYLCYFFLLITTSPVFGDVFSASDFTNACPVYDDFVAVFTEGYNVTYSCGTGNGSVPGTVTAHYGVDFTTATNACTKSGYTFVGWRVSGTDDIKFSGVPFEWDYTENKTLTAVWLAEDWQTGTTRFVNACPVYDDFVAVFTEGYNVTYSCGTGNGSVPGTVTAHYGVDFTTATNACTKSGYTFFGWRVSGTDDIKFSGVPFEWDYTENKTLTAVWLAEDWQNINNTRYADVCPYFSDFVAVFTPSPVHNITYDMDGGTNYANAPTEYTAGTGATINGMPTRTGYVFTGWTGSNGNTPELTVTIGTSDTGDKSYTANWSQCSACAATNATCTFNGVVDNNCSYTTACETGYGNIQNNGAHNASCSPNSITINWGDGESESCSYGEELTVPATPPTRRGYTFVGWTFE